MEGWEIIKAALTVLGGFIGGLAAVLISGRQQHSRWVLENEKLEYREVIDGLKHLVDTVIAVRPGSEKTDPDGLNAAVHTFALLVDSRIFIAKALRKGGFLDEWQKLKNYIHADSDQEGPRYGITSLGVREGQLRQLLLKIAAKDLKL